MKTKKTTQAIINCPYFLRVVKILYNPPLLSALKKIVKILETLPKIMRKPTKGNISSNDLSMLFLNKMFVRNNTKTKTPPLNTKELMNNVV